MTLRLDKAFPAIAFLLFAACGEGQQSGNGSGASGTSGLGGGSTSGGTGGVSASGGASATGGGATTGGSGGAAAGMTATGGAMPGTGGTDSGGSSGQSGGTSGDGAGGATAGSGGADMAGTGGTAGSAGTPTIDCPDPMTLEEAGDCTGRLIGTALSTAHLGEADYATHALEFNYATAENEMKWDQTQPTRGQFTYAAGDQVVDFAIENGMQVKGHTLVWYSQLPSWVSNITDAEDLRTVMVDHITNVMQHYAGRVVAWDVVNEAWDPGDPTMLRDNVFLRLLGPGYIDEAFIAARAADPEAKLYYNDYGTDGLSTKANSVYEMARSMVERGIPIDGVGLQMHWRSVGSTLTAADVAENIRRLGELGLEVVISEMDVQLCNGGTIEDQAVRYHDIVAACVRQPNCPAVTFWGITDRYSWLNDRAAELNCTESETPSPLLWDDNYEKKPAYTAVMDALRGL